MLLVVEPSAIAMGVSFFGPLMAQMVTAMRAFDERELATVRRFLLAMIDVVTASRGGRGPAIQVDGAGAAEPPVPHLAGVVVVEE